MERSTGDVPASTSASPAFPDVAAALTFKLPEFWTSDAELWFLTIDSLFRKNRITSQLSKFDHVVAALPQHTAAVIRDILRAPPEDEPYNILKRELIRRTTASEQRRLQQLLTTEELGDRKPSELLRRMQQLLGDRVDTLDGSILRELFFQRLPEQVRMILVTSSSESLETLASMADKIMDASTVGLNAVHQRFSQPEPTENFKELSDKLAQLCITNERLLARVDQLSKEVRDIKLTRSRSPSPRDTPTGGSRPRSLSHSRDHRWCWYHRKHGNFATRCQQPCRFPGNSKTTC